MQTPIEATESDDRRQAKLLAAGEHHSAPFVTSRQVPSIASSLLDPSPLVDSSDQPHSVGKERPRTTLPEPTTMALLTSLTERALSNLNVTCPLSDVRIAQDDDGRHIVEITLSAGSCPDPLSAGAYLAQAIGRDTTAMTEPNMVRIRYR